MKNSDKLQFHGFQEPQLLRAACDELEILTEPPSLVEAADSAVAPLKYRGRTNSGVYDSQNRLIASSARIRHGRRIEGELDPDQLRKPSLDRRRAYYLGSGEKHYGHFLLEVLCRAWAWEERDRDRVAVLQSNLPHFAKALCELVPGLADRIEVVRRPTRFASMLVPGASFVIGRQAHVAFKRMCEHMADRAMDSLPAATDQPLYLSRAGLDPSRRGLEGELWLEQFLDREGFRIVRPEALPIREQIALFNRHRWIVSTVGSASHTRVFSLRANNFVTIAPPFFNQNHVLCDLLCEGSAHYVNALVKPYIGTEFDLESIEPLMLDAQAVVGVLQSLGLVRTSAAFDAPTPDLREYKLRWLAAARWRLKGNPPNARELLNAIDAVTAVLGADKSERCGAGGFPDRGSLRGPTGGDSPLRRLFRRVLSR